MSHIALPIAELKPALTGLSKIIGRRNSLPILNHVLVERTTDGWITLTANNLEQGATVRLEKPAEGEPCAMLVPLEDLHKTAKNCAKSDLIAIEKTGRESLILHYPIGQQSAQNRIATLPVEEFPPFPEMEGASISVPDTLRISIHEAIECSSDDPSRYILNGAFIDVTQPECNQVVGTNGRILYSSNSFSLPLEKSVVIPRHPFLAWKEFNHDGEWQMRVRQSTPALFEIKTRRWTYTCKQIDGDYPNWRQVVPAADSFHTTITLDDRTLDSIIQIIERLPNYDETNLTVGLKVAGKRFSLLGKSVGAVPWTEVDLTFCTVKGKDVTIYVNRNFLTAALNFGLNRIDIIDGMSPLKLSQGGRQTLISPVRSEQSPTTIKAGEEKAGEGEAESVNSEPEPPAATSTDRSIMVTQTHGTTNAINGNGTAASPTTTAEEAPAGDIDQVIETIEDLRASLSTKLADLKTVAGKLKQMKKDQKATEKEIQSFRQTLKSLQGVKL